MWSHGDMKIQIPQFLVLIRLDSEKAVVTDLVTTAF